jgi:hypothetical protein
MLPDADSLASEVTAAIVREVPQYSRPDDESYARAVHRVARTALRHFAERAAAPAPPPDAGPPAHAAPSVRVGRATARMLRDIGRAEAVAGRGRDVLLTAIWVGIRVTWQRVCERVIRDGGDAEVVARLGQAIYCYLDELCAAGSAGYTRAQAELVGEAERLRHRLLDLLLSDPPPSPEAVSSLARAAAWRPPRQVAAVALTIQAVGALGPLPPDVLSGTGRREPCLLVPDPDGPGRGRLLEKGLRTWPASSGAARPGARPGDVVPGGATPGPMAVVGPVVPLGQAADSLRWARRALDLGRRGLAWQADRIVRCDDDLASLMLLADTGLADVLSSRALAPLEGLRPDMADRLAETLLAWLESAENAGVVARRLQVHPQTVRYRLRRLAELFGERLSDPDARFDLQIALRVRRLASE